MKIPGQASNALICGTGYRVNIPIYMITSELKGCAVIHQA